LGDRVAVLRRGILQQVATPRELYEQPVNLFVAGFIGSPPMNFIPATLEGNQMQLPFASFELPSDIRSVIGARDLLIVGIRPESFEDTNLVDESKLSRGVTFSVKVDVVEWLGNEQYAYVPYEAHEEIARQLADLERELDSEQIRTQMVIALDPMSEIRDGSTAPLWFNPRRIHVFDPRTGENLTREVAKARA
jgi:multiple sugar transport system ATP-binding protein